jgi:hypothetical protein
MAALHWTAGELCLNLGLQETERERRETSMHPSDGGWLIKKQAGSVQCAGRGEWEEAKMVVMTSDAATRGVETARSCCGWTADGNGREVGGRRPGAAPSGRGRIRQGQAGAGAGRGLME